MKRIDIMAGFTPEDVRVVAEMLTGGAVGVIPTDTVYGLAAVANDRSAVARVLEIKDRPADKPLTVQVASLREARLLAELDDTAEALAERFWPGPLTMILPRRPGGAAGLPFQEAESIGLRIPDDDFCASLIEHAGYLVVPSANRRGMAAPVRAEEMSAELLEEVDFVVNAGACSGGVESTVVDLTGGAVRVKREGAVPAGEIARVAGGSRADG